jgi:hypothetical protein
MSDNSSSRPGSSANVAAAAAAPGAVSGAAKEILATKAQIKVSCTPLLSCSVTSDRKDEPTTLPAQKHQGM